MANTTDTMLSAIRALKESMISSTQNFSLNEADKDEEEITLAEINLGDDELFKFGKVPDNVYECGEIFTASTLNKFVTNLFQSIFADVYSARIEFRNNRYQIALSFKFISDKEYEQMFKNDDEKLARAIVSSFEPTRQKSAIENILALNSNQQIAVSDAKKYASFTKEAKQYLTLFLLFDENNKKKRWIQGTHYNIGYKTGTSYNGMRYNYIEATVYLDALITFSYICASKENRKKYYFSLDHKGYSTNGTDELYLIHRYSNRIEKKYRNEYNIFSVK